MSTPDITGGARRRVMVLPELLANKIAAGEVIQRPDSVVKELMENALDAGATTVQVIIKEGGKDSIQVTDDGAGMDEQDAVASFLRHATSKIATYEDLEEIRTYGFRGEALASVAAVAQVTLKTRRPEDETAVVVKVAGSDQSVSRDARAPGTTVTVQNLFYNVPARRKFLKSTNTEFRHIYDTVQRNALAHPDLAFEFISDGETVFRLKPGTLEQRLLDLFGQRSFESLIPLSEETDFLSVHGYIGKPEFGQKSRLGQYLFLNNRFIVNKSISYAVHSAYETLMIKGSFPFFLLFLAIDPRRIDVNVHPSKLEAKFDDEQGVHRFVASVARKALAAAGAVPALSMTDIDPRSGETSFRFTSRQHVWNDRAPQQNTAWTFPQRERVDLQTGELLGAAGAAVQSHDGERPEQAGGQLLWQLHNRYILSQIRNGVMIVDQHVAHERILYEQALDRMDRGLRASQQLLFPVTLELTPGDAALLEELMPWFEQLGFDLKPFGRNTVVVEGVPQDVRPGNEQAILNEMLEQYKEYQEHSPTDVRDTIAKSYSCRTAIKSGDQLSEAEMRSLIDQLFATKMPYVCPHGRPVLLRISTEELDRRFGRT